MIFSNINDVFDSNQYNDKFEYDDRQFLKIKMPEDWVMEQKLKKLHPWDFNQLTMLEKVTLFENEMKKEKQIDLKVNHHFSKDVYARELFIPKGVILTGHIHKYENLNIMTKGDMSVLVGEEVKRIKAPFIVVSPPGTKRIAYAHEDTIWITIHGTDEKDLDKIENKFIAKTDKEWLQHERILQLTADLNGLD